MTSGIRKIIAPVGLDESSLSFAKQAAEFCSRYGAELRLLHVASKNECKGRFLNMLTLNGANEYFRMTSEKQALLATWKKEMEKTFRIAVSTQVEWGSRSEQVLEQTIRFNADAIALPGYLSEGSRWPFKKSRLEYMLEKSSCQVITIFSGTKPMNDWKQVVIPVTDCIPETRIRAISGIANHLRLKVHLVTVNHPNQGYRKSEFYFLTETLKRLKPAGNIQVQCHCLSATSNQVHSFLKYARTVDADLMLTNMRSSKSFDPVVSAPVFM